MSRRRHGKTVSPWAPVGLGIAGIVLAVLSAVIWAAATAVLMIAAPWGYYDGILPLAEILYLVCPAGVVVGVLMLAAGLVLGFTRALGRA